MTSRPSRPPRSSGSDAARAALAAFGALLIVAHARPLPAREPASADAGARATLVESRDGVTVDWQAGTLTATGGAAADLRMPSVDLARPGAVRRATTAANARLRSALGGLAIGAKEKEKLTDDDVERAVARARTTDVQYQSNGGAIVTVQARFGDWLAAPVAAEPVAKLSVAAMRLSAAPVARIGARDGRIGAALYRTGPAPAGTRALAARVDAAGRLVLAGADAALGDKLARGSALIYVQKVER